MNKGKYTKKRPTYRQHPWVEGDLAHPLTGTYYDTAQMMQVMHVSERTLLRLRKEGEIPFTKIGGKIYYLAEAVDRKMRESDNDHD